MPEEEIKKIGLNEKEYPSLLRKTSDPPKIIYVKGTIPRAKFLAIVGTRHFSPYGKQVTLEIGHDLTLSGLGIISGLAKGIDTFSHQACLEAGGKTIAVLGTGLDKESIYPRENLRLSQEIVERGGCLISELPPGSPGFKGNFPRRNRIIAGLSLGVLVVEAKQKSGALITAAWARKENRKIFAIPGPIYSANAWGPNHLIRKGAKLVQSANDILSELKFSRQPCLFSKEKKNKIGDSPEENLILENLKEQPLHIEEIIKRTSLSAPKVCSILAIMELKNLIRNLGEKTFSLKN